MVAQTSKEPNFDSLAPFVREVLWFEKFSTGIVKILDVATVEEYFLSELSKHVDRKYQFLVDRQYSDQ